MPVTEIKEMCIRDRLKHCHLAVITKSDLVDSYKIAELEKKIREINPVCKLTTSIQGKMDYSFLDDDLLLYQWAESEETTNTEETKPKTLFMEIYDDVDKNPVSYTHLDVYKRQQDYCVQ